MNKKGQVTIFIVVAIILVAAATLFFVFRDSFSSSNIPSDVEPIYSTFLSCIEDYTYVGVDVLESQGGYIYLPDFEAGSEYMPFGSQLDFLGNPIPYWYYVSGNNMEKEQVPSISDMEEDLSRFIEERARNCELETYYDQGFEIIQGEPKAEVTIKDEEVEINLNMDFVVKKENESTVLRNHKVIIKSYLGDIYSSAKELYDYEQSSLFLEDYAVDILRLYAPVDGVELTCSPMVWNIEEVFDDLQEAITENTLALKTKGNDYTLAQDENKYFVIDFETDADIKFVNSPNWSYSFEVNPSEGGILMAKPAGNQQTLGVLGFCYIPYHFVYNIKYPVLVQLYKGDDFFQFPMAVVIQGNKKREALNVTTTQTEILDFCEYKNTLTKVNTYDSTLASVEANISYICSGTNCLIGETSDGTLQTDFPQCYQGYILATADGYQDSKETYSVIEYGEVELLLNKLYELDLELEIDSDLYNGNAIINFVSNDSSKTIVYPEQKTVELTEGQYQIKVYTYENSSIKISEKRYEQCIDTTAAGLKGLIGLTEEKCFEVTLPEQIVSNALSGGGTTNYYIVESELSSNNKIIINAESLPRPNSLEQLQKNYELYEEKNLEVYFN